MPRPADHRCRDHGSLRDSPSRPIRRMAIALVLLTVLTVSGCTRAVVGTEVSMDAPDHIVTGADSSTASLPAPARVTATALYRMLNATPAPRPPIACGAPPLLDWHLEIDRAPCAGEPVVLRSVLDFASDSELATRHGKEIVTGEIWLEFPGDVMSIVKASPGPTRVEGHGRPRETYAAVWEGVTMRAGSVDIREITFRTHEESYDHKKIWAYFSHAPTTVPPADEDLVLSLPRPSIFLQVGGQTQYPQAVQDVWEIGPDQPNRCATPDADTDAESGTDSAP